MTNIEIGTNKIDQAYYASDSWKSAIDEKFQDAETFICFEYNGYYGGYSDSEPFRLFINQVAGEFVRAFDGLTLYAAHGTECHMIPDNEITQYFMTQVWSDSWGYLYEDDTSTLESAIQDVLTDCGYEGDYTMDEDVVCLYEHELRELREYMENNEPYEGEVLEALMSGMYDTGAYSRGYAMDYDFEHAINNNDSLYINEDDELCLNKKEIHIYIDLTPIEGTIDNLCTLEIKSYYNDTPLHLPLVLKTHVWNFSMLRGAIARHRKNVHADKIIVSKVE